MVELCEVLPKLKTSRTTSDSLHRHNKKDMLSVDLYYGCLFVLFLVYYCNPTTSGSVDYFSVWCILDTHVSDTNVHTCMYFSYDSHINQCALLDLSSSIENVNLLCCRQLVTIFSIALSFEQPISCSVCPSTIFRYRCVLFSFFVYFTRK